MIGVTTAQLPIDGWQIILTAGVAYFSPMLVALANRHHWPSHLKFACAVGVAALSALAGIAIGTISTAAFLTALGPAFIIQQAVWRFELPIAGDPGILDKILTVGAEATPDHDASIPPAGDPELPLD